MRQQEYNEIQDATRAIWILLSILILASLLAIVSSAKINDCGEVAQAKAKELRMEIVWVQYLQPSGAYLFDGKNGAHILNSKIINGKRYYFDFSSAAYYSLIFNSQEEVSEYYKSKSGYDNEIYIIGVDSIPFRYSLD